MELFGITDKGIVRKDNQDYFSVKRCANKSCNIIALCDGMGGAMGGEIASKLSNEVFCNYIYSKLTSRTNKKPDIEHVLEDACSEANDTAFDYSQLDVSLNGMGSTLVGGIVFDDGNVHLVNVGDSRAYLFSFINNSICQITKDHSLVEDLVESGIISKEQAKNHPQKNIITRAIGTEESIESDYYHVRLDFQDMLLLCSDGLSNYMNEDEMLVQYLIDNNPKNFCEKMLSTTLKRGAGDNVTLIAVVNR